MKDKLAVYFVSKCRFNCVARSVATCSSFMEIFWNASLKSVTKAAKKSALISQALGGPDSCHMQEAKSAAAHSGSLSVQSDQRQCLIFTFYI